MYPKAFGCPLKSLLGHEESSGIRNIL